jgi:hypothetical protein
VGTNDGYVNNTGGSEVDLFNCSVGSGTTNVMTVSGLFITNGSAVYCPVNFVTGSNLLSDFTTFGKTITLSNNSTGYLRNFTATGGASAAITMSSSAAIALTHGVVSSSNNPAIAGAGAGTLTYSDLVFTGNAAFAGTLTLATVAWRPYSQEIASTDATKVGTCAFNSSQFNVDTNGFVSLQGGGVTWIDQATGIVLAINTGYFVTAATTQTLPASPSQGDVVKIVADTTGAVVVTANTGQQIRVGTTISSTAGTMTSTLQGDSLELIYRAASTTWVSIATTGVWVPT